MTQRLPHPWKIKNCIYIHNPTQKLLFPRGSVCNWASVSAKEIDWSSIGRRHLCVSGNHRLLSFLSRRTRNRRQMYYSVWLNKRASEWVSNGVRHRGEEEARIPSRPQLPALCCLRAVRGAKPQVKHQPSGSQICAKRTRVSSLIAAERWSTRFQPLDLPSAQNHKLIQRWDLILASFFVPQLCAYLLICDKNWLNREQEKLDSCLRLFVTASNWFPA